MTREDPLRRRAAQSPYAIRHQTFASRRRGLDPEEVAAFLDQLAEQIERGDAERAELRAEVERHRNAVVDTDARGMITADAVGLLSQAQQIADNLVGEAEQYAKDLIEQARSQNRDALLKARDSVESAVRQLGPDDSASAAELEYVRTFAQVAHVQLRSVLDALAEQVERLGHLPQPPKPGPGGTDSRPRGHAAPQQPQEDPLGGEVEWWTDLSATDDGERAQGSLSRAAHRPLG